MIEQVIAGLGNVLGKIPAPGRDRREVHDNALRAISHALTETYLYYRSLEAGQQRNAEVEAQLSRYWAAAAIPLRHLDRDLASTCEYKAEYWLNPEDWSAERVRRVGIGLDDVRHRYRQLLTPGRIGKPFRREKGGR
jgi:hypothetical protein